MPLEKLITFCGNANEYPGAKEWYKILKLYVTHRVMGADVCFIVVALPLTCAWLCKTTSSLVAETWCVYFDI